MLPSKTIPANAGIASNKHRLRHKKSRPSRKRKHIPDVAEMLPSKKSHCPTIEDVDDEGKDEQLAISKRRALTTVILYLKSFDFFR